MTASLFRSFAAIVATSLSLQYVSAITTTEQLGAWEAEIEREEGSLGAKFMLHPARAHQLEAFEQGGVEWAQRYSDSWGGWIYMDWSSASELHARLVRELRASLMDNRPSQPVSEAALIQHRDSMQDFRWRNGKIRRLLEVRIQLNVYRGQESDKAHEAHVAHVAASIAKASVVAEAMEAKEEYHSQRADEWAALGAEASAMIRQLGGTDAVDADRFSGPYRKLLDLAKSGALPEKAIEGSREQ